MIKKEAAPKESPLPCQCDLDNWEPEKDSGHSRVCPIDKNYRAALKLAQESK